MFVTVTGGSGSGKSAFAEEQILKFPEKNRLYIATMVCFDEESRQRVKRHRKMRKEKHSKGHGGAPGMYVQSGGK